MTRSPPRDHRPRLPLTNDGTESKGITDGRPFGPKHNWCYLFFLCSPRALPSHESVEGELPPAAINRPISLSQSGAQIWGRSLTDGMSPSSAWRPERAHVNVGAPAGFVWSLPRWSARKQSGRVRVGQEGGRGAKWGNGDTGAQGAMSEGVSHTFILPP